MSDSTSAEHTTAVATGLAQLGVRPGDRVLIMLPDGPGFAAAFAATIEHQAVPLPVNPVLVASDIAAAATKAAAQLLIASPQQIHTLTHLGTEPPVLINGTQGPWAAILRLPSVSNKPTRKQVVLLPHAAPSPPRLRPRNRRALERPPAQTHGDDSDGSEPGRRQIP